MGVHPGSLGTVSEGVIRAGVKMRRWSSCRAHAWAHVAVTAARARALRARMDVITSHQPHRPR
ncbi:hypothetical protein MXAN_6801 [Myxococcus xanthus DK 1622]|uniref:Uncharacterized protein n=1 Tax=Myxococcus xanthus (strain DK1622) TaxID=246197 RepID=Q1CXF5_MYXXD|nr:hypothetical protein MXAN_6801 [Myxococcus xanthus DK 1622]